jgi:pimeloyl-ACP methyl ester carboxylesterase
MLLSGILLIVLSVELLLLGWIGNAWVGTGTPTYVVIGALLLFACFWRSLLVLTTFALSGALRGQRPMPAIKTIAGEVLVVLYLYTYAQVFCAIFYRFKQSRRASAAQPRNGPVIVLVHGFVCNAGLWVWMIRHLRAAGFARVHTVDLDPLYRSMSKSLAQFEASLSKIMQLENSHEEVILIGHSMGGVLARVFQNRHPERVLAAISIGAPHAGTDLARLVSTVDSGPARPDTRWLVEFNAALAAEQDATLRPALNIWSDSDNIVYPQGNAALSAGVDRRLNGLGHLHLAFSKRALNLVVEFLDKLGKH